MKLPLFFRVLGLTLLVTALGFVLMMPVWGIWQWFSTDLTVSAAVSFGAVKLIVTVIILVIAAFLMWIGAQLVEGVYDPSATDYLIVIAGLASGAALYVLWVGEVDGAWQVLYILPVATLSAVISKLLTGKEYGK